MFTRRGNELRGALSESQLEEILSFWNQHCTASMLAQIEPLNDIIDVVLTLFEMWMNDEPFAPHLDAAVRDWGRRSPAASMRSRAGGRPGSTPTGATSSIPSAVAARP